MERKEVSISIPRPLHEAHEEVQQREYPNRNCYVVAAYRTSAKVDIKITRQFSAMMSTVQILNSKPKDHKANVLTPGRASFHFRLGKIVILT